MIKTIILNGKTIEYNLQYKNVKNINLRVKSDGSIHVSANRRVSGEVIEKFIASKADFLIKAVEKCKGTKPKKRYFSDDEIKSVILSLCEKVYPYFKKRGVKYPVVKFRKMTSRWGSCNPMKNVLTFNTNLLYAPIECVEYVVLHEFTHFLVPDHSKLFYAELEKVCPDWKACRKKMKDIYIR